MKKNNLRQRFKSILVDSCSIFIVSIPFIATIFIGRLENNLLYQTFVVSLICSLFLCKDLAGGRSIGKRLFNLQIVSLENHSVSSLKLIFRNIFTFMWPIEIVFCLIDSEKKLGDIVFGTKVIMLDSNMNNVNLSTGKVISYFFIVLFCLFAIFYFILFALCSNNGLIKILYS
jgi:uncharacterized RDD family membrane protein YckC